METNALDEKSADLLSWLQQQEGFSVSPKIMLLGSSFPGSGRGHSGMVALDDVAEAEHLFQIPTAVVLSVKNSDLRSLMPDGLASLDPWLALILTMMYEVGKGENSKWWTYLKMLPETFESLMYWTPLELAELQGSAVKSKIGRADADRMFIESLLPLAAANASLFGSFAAALENPDAKDFLLTLAHRMATLILANGFDLEDYDQDRDPDEDGYVSDDEATYPKGLVPLADLLNADHKQHNAYLYQEDSALSMKAIKEIKKGDEILVDHGPIPTSEHVRRYGYITRENKTMDEVELDNERILKILRSENFANDKISKSVDFAKDYEIWDEGFAVQHLDRDLPIASTWGGIDQGLIHLLSMLTVNENDQGAVKALKKSNFVPTIDTDIGNLLRKIIINRQKDYATTVAEDVHVLKDPTISKRYRMAIEIRLGEKEILASSIHFLDRRMAELSEKAKLEADSTRETSQQMRNRQGTKRRKL